MWRKRNRRRPERPALSIPAVPWRAVAAAVAAVAILAGGYTLTVWVLNRPIETIVINGAFQRVSPIQLEAMVEPYAHSGFLEVDLGATRRDLVALPWVASAEVRRKWPGTLEIRISEEKPIACWGERGLLNAAGEVFLPDADHVPAELPRLHGPSGSEAEVTARFFAVQEQLEHRGMSAIGMTLDERGAWTFRLASGVEVRLGANGVDERIGRFFHVLDSTLAHLAGEVDYVDMRYPNGFAIGWKSQDPMRAAASEEPTPNA
jgi:cell division protein FtsQ